MLIECTQDDPTYRQQINRDGFAIRSGVIDVSTTDALIQSMNALGEREEVRHRRGAYGIRNLLRLEPMVSELAKSPSLRSFVEPILGPKCFAVRGIFFDKIVDANWKVAWHQDRFIAVAERLEIEGYGPWSEKPGGWQVKPPVEVLEDMLTLRIHLDDCNRENGPLRVLSGSHCQGWLDSNPEQWKARFDEVCCDVPSGGVLAMRPLLMHASSEASTPSHRRVIHIEYAVAELKGDLEWCDQVMPGGDG